MIYKSIALDNFYVWKQLHILIIHRYHPTVMDPCSFSVVTKIKQFNEDEERHRNNTTVVDHATFPRLLLLLQG